MCNGCWVARETATLPANVVTSVKQIGQPMALDPAVLQAQLQRYADDFNGRTAAALDEYAGRMVTAEARNEALRWKVALQASVLGIASGPNSRANLLDFVTLSSLMRAFLDERASASPRSDFRPWLEWLETSRLRGGQCLDAGRGNPYDGAVRRAAHGHRSVARPLRPNSSIRKPPNS
jgi:hypothetical protein